MKRTSSLWCSIPAVLRVLEFELVDQISPQQAVVLGLLLFHSLPLAVQGLFRALEKTEIETDEYFKLVFSEATFEGTNYSG